MATTHTMTLLYILMEEWRRHSLVCSTHHCL
uniref:Uncharacterized protein n=1 Tax=Podoviridae sp. ctG4L18 TaxID=2825234 RepID=A0A8S5UPG6_9CAUD|nr:MAG TPA: hypothetical protein [Podoviridae sp. ctG4L18]DAO74376.1 MAG TPA: hypothetical protein [Bacteriophage sp.]